MQNPNIPISQHQCCSFLSFQPQWFHDSTSPETNDAVRRQASPNQAPTSGIELSKPWLPEGINWCILAKKKLLTTVLFFHNNHGSKDEKALYMYMASEGNKALKSITHLQRRRNFPGFHRGFLLPRCNRVFVVSFCVFGAPLGLV